MTAVHFVQPQPYLTRQQLMSAVLTREQMEVRRKQAAELLEKGVSQSAISRRLFVSRTSVSRWAARLGQGDTLRKRRPAGRPCRLNPEQHQVLRDLFRADPAHWTCTRLAKVILDQFGVSYHSDRAGVFLKRLREEGKGAAR